MASFNWVGWVFLIPQVIEILQKKMRVMGMDRHVTNTRHLSLCITVLMQRYWYHPLVCSPHTQRQIDNWLAMLLCLYGSTTNVLYHKQLKSHAACNFYIKRLKKLIERVRQWSSLPNRFSFSFTLPESTVMFTIKSLDANPCKLLPLYYDLFGSRIRLTPYLLLLQVTTLFN